MNAANVILAITMSFVTVAAFYDLRTGHIPNRLTLAGLAAAPLVQLAARFLVQRPESAELWNVLGYGLGSAIAGMLACGLVPYLLFLKNAMGGGDVKLLAGTGALLGPMVGLEVELYAFVIMALFAPARLAYEGRLLQVLGNSAALLLNPVLPKQRRRQISPELLSSLKFGPAVFAGMLVVTLLRWRAGA